MPADLSAEACDDPLWKLLHQQYLLPTTSSRLLQAPAYSEPSYICLKFTFPLDNAHVWGVRPFVNITTSLSVYSDPVRSPLQSPQSLEARWLCEVWKVRKEHFISSTHHTIKQVIIFFFLLGLYYIQSIKHIPLLSSNNHNLNNKSIIIATLEPFMQTLLAEKMSAVLQRKLWQSFKRFKFVSKRP